MRDFRYEGLVTVFSAIKARLFFLSSAYREVQRAKVLFPGLRVRLHFLDDDWGMSRPLCLSGEFDVEISRLKVESNARYLEVKESWQYREIQAFLAGEGAVSAHFREFRKAVPESTAHEDYRRSRTPLLLTADPAKFLILVSVDSENRVLIRDGSHRASVALFNGCETIRAKLIAPFSPNFGWEWFLIPFYTTLRRAIRKQKTAAPF